MIWILLIWGCDTIRFHRFDRGIVRFLWFGIHYVHLQLLHNMISFFPFCNNDSAQHSASTSSHSIYIIVTLSTNNTWSHDTHHCYDSTMHLDLFGRRPTTSTTASALNDLDERCWNTSNQTENSQHSLRHFEHEMIWMIDRMSDENHFINTENHVTLCNLSFYSHGLKGWYADLILIRIPSKTS